MELGIFKGYERFKGSYPAAAVEYALKNREESVPELLAILSHTRRHAKFLAHEPDYLVHIPATYLLACFREPRALEDIAGILSLPDDLAYELYGDAITEDFRNIVASVCGGDIGPIQAVIENDTLEEFTRAEMLEALLVLLANGEVSRDTLAAYFLELLRGKVSADDTIVMGTLIHCCAMIHPGEFMDDIRRLAAEDPVINTIVDTRFLDSQQLRPVGEVLEELKGDYDYSFVDVNDVRFLEEWVGVESDRFDDDDDDGYEDDFYDSPEEDDYDGAGFGSPLNVLPLRNDVAIQTQSTKPVSAGRNDPCPCGSGKKYKKCCLGKENLNENENK